MLMTQVALTFSVAGTRMALEASSVREVVPSVKLVTVPEMPRLLRGFVAIDQEMVPVIRLEQILDPGASSPPMRLQDRIVIIELEGQALGWLADADMETLHFRTRDTVALPAGHVLNRCATHVVSVNPPIVLLNPQLLLLEAERARLQQLRQRLQERLADVGAAEAPMPGL
ncbi:MAG: chemotaxis protein CheW [Verrucomicrobiaceae bacterium]|nr:chemotaxis protein CheW [Verrucomicrobiaceae bacterium]